MKEPPMFQHLKLLNNILHRKELELIIKLFCFICKISLLLIEAEPNAIG